VEVVVLLDGGAVVPVEVVLVAVQVVVVALGTAPASSSSNTLPPQAQQQLLAQQQALLQQAQQHPHLIAQQLPPEAQPPMTQPDLTQTQPMTGTAPHITHQAPITEPPRIPTGNFDMDTRQLPTPNYPSSLVSLLPLDLDDTGNIPITPANIPPISTQTIIHFM
jgi:hypothetical protein